MNESFIWSVYSRGRTESENTPQKMKFSVTGFFSECVQIRRKLRLSAGDFLLDNFNNSTSW